MSYQRECEAAIEAVRTAARVCRAVQATITPDVLKKEDRSPVTVADFGSQAIICRALAEACPQDPVIGEEDAAALRTPENAPFLDRIREELAAVGLPATAEEVFAWIDHNATTAFSDRFWTLDPIDGTQGFLRGDQYAISLALLVEGRIELALLGCPNLPVEPGRPEPAGAIFYAIRGQGCRMIPLDGDEQSEEKGTGSVVPPAGSVDSGPSTVPVPCSWPGSSRPIHVSKTSDPTQARLCEPFVRSHTAPGRSAEIARRLGITREPLRLDSQAKYAVVARGETDIYLRLPSKPGFHQKIWDHAGGVLLVEEAGGTVTDVAGRPLDWTRGHELTANRGIVVSNGRLHERLLAAIAETGVQ